MDSPRVLSRSRLLPIPLAAGKVVPVFHQPKLSLLWDLYPASAAEGKPPVCARVVPLLRSLQPVDREFGKSLGYAGRIHIGEEGLPRQARQLPHRMETKSIQLLAYVI